MLQPKRLLNLENFTNFLLSVIPISLIAGSLIVNLNILAFIIFGAILIRKKRLAFQLNKTKLFRLKDQSVGLYVPPTIWYDILYKDKKILFACDTGIGGIYKEIGEKYGHRGGKFNR